MTEVNIDIVNQGYESHPDDRVVIYSPANRNHAGQIISTAVKEIPLVDGKADEELAPGPVVVRFECLGVADTREKMGYIPEAVEGSDPISLADVILDWTPALVDQGILAILSALEQALGDVADAVAAESESIRWKHGQLPSDVTALADVPDGEWIVASASHATALDLPAPLVSRLSKIRFGSGIFYTVIAGGANPRLWLRYGESGQWWTPPSAEDMSRVEEKTQQISSEDQAAFRVTDREGLVALSVTPTGDTVIGDTEVQAALPGFRIMDSDGMVALEVSADGSVVIPDLIGGDTPGEVDVEIDTLHVFVLAGQSNMSGRGQPLKGQITPRIKQFGSTRRVIEDAPIRLDMHDTALGTSPGRFFAEHYIAQQPARVGILLVPTAHGGTGFVGSPESPASGRTWTKGAASDPANALYEQSVAQAIEAIAAAKAAGFHPILKAVLWHQGETNSLTPPAEYQARLDELIADYRAQLESPRLPFLVGRMAPEGIAAGGDRVLIDQVHVDTIRRVAHTGIADAPENGHNPGDTTHLSTIGTSHLGATYMDAYYQALGNLDTERSS